MRPGTFTGPREMREPQVPGWQEDLCSLTVFCVSKIPEKMGQVRKTPQYGHGKKGKVLA